MTSGKLPTVWHVGRRGEVAGGMTQVVNGYLKWRFEHSFLDVIVTRDGSAGLKGLIVFFKGLIRFFQIRDLKKNMFVVHLSQGGSFIREGMLLWLATLRGFGTVAHIHGSQFVDFAQRNPTIVRFILAKARIIIVLSDATQNKIAELLPSANIQLVPNAVPSGKLVPKEKLIVFGGSVSFRKGVDVLVQAWSSITNKSDWKLIIAGPIKDSEVVPVSLESAEFVGSVAHEKLMELLERSSVAVLPSRDEAMPMFILEALARKNCVISTTVGGIPDVLSNNKGILVEPGDANALSDALNHVISDDAYRENITSTGHASYLQSYSAETIYPRMERLWHSVLTYQHDTLNKA